MYRIIFYFLRFYYAEMSRKLWPKAPAKEGAMGQMSENFQVYCIHIFFFKKPMKKNLQWSQRVILRTYYIWFFILCCLIAQKRWKLKNGPRLLTLPYNIFNFFISLFHKFIYQWGSIKYYRTGLGYHETYSYEIRNKKPYVQPNPWTWTI